MLFALHTADNKLSPDCPGEAFLIDSQHYQLHYFIYGAFKRTGLFYYFVKPKFSTVKEKRASQDGFQCAEDDALKGVEGIEKANGEIPFVSIVLLRPKYLAKDSEE